MALPSMRMAVGRSTQATARISTWLRGKLRHVAIPVTVTDTAGATDVQNLVITVNGTNDGAVISGAGAQLREDSAVSASGELEANGQLTVQDVDSGEAAFTPIADVIGDSGYGHFSLSADGQWQYHAEWQSARYPATGSG
ncbi:VCBS domain-containing protein [Vibrio sp. M60_M31a]